MDFDLNKHNKKKSNKIQQNIYTVSCWFLLSWTDLILLRQHQCSNASLFFFGSWKKVTVCFMIFDFSPKPNQIVCLALKSRSEISGKRGAVQQLSEREGIAKHVFPGHILSCIINCTFTEFQTVFVVLWCEALMQPACPFMRCRMFSRHEHRNNPPV